MSSGHGDDERHHGANQHHAFHTEVEYSGALGDELTQCREHQRRACGERQCNQRREVFEHHAPALLPVRSAVTAAAAEALRRTTRTRKLMKTSAASKKKSSVPWNSPVTAEGNARAICADSPPRYSNDISRLASRMPKGCKRPTKATMIAAKPYPGDIEGSS